jgi:type II secretory pathway pseudopilin PulG
VKRGESGTTLLEVIVALAILGGAGLVLTAEVRQSLAATMRIQAAERDVVEASAFLEAVALWPRGDLDRHLGNRRNGPWRLLVLRSSEALYEVSVRDSADTRTLVGTTLYRSGDDAQR